MDNLNLESEEEEEWYDAHETSLQPSYVTILTEDEIRRRMEKKIRKVSDTYSISEIEATSLLLYFFWSISEFHKQWFGNTSRVRESVGILETPLNDIIPSTDTEFYCGVCSETRPLENSASVSCGCRVCTSCWTREINIIINDIPARNWNVWLKCPYDYCQASVGRDMVERFASEKEKSMYNTYLLKSYVEGSKTMNLCPRATTGRSCRIDSNPDSGNSKVYCICFLGFCWNCSKDVHSPVDCGTAARWLADKQWEMVELASDRASDCYRNWMTNETLMQRAKANLKQLDTIIQAISNTQLLTESEIKIILEPAWLQIMECTRVLKWTYAYGYYLREDVVGKQAFLKNKQVDSEDLLKKLYTCTEDFTQFTTKLTEQTRITQLHFERLVREIEDGLTSVFEPGSTSQIANNDDASGFGHRARSQRKHFLRAPGFLNNIFICFRPNKQNLKKVA